MDVTNETTLTSTTTTLPPIARSRSLTCIQQPSTSQLHDSIGQINRSLSSSYIVDDAEPRLDKGDDDDDDDDSEELRALASGTAGLDEDTDAESEETTAVFDQNGQSQEGSGQTVPSNSHLHAPLSSSSASVLGRIAAGFSTAVSGGLHPLKRSPRVAPDLPTPRSPSPKEFFWGPVMPGYSTSPLDGDGMKGGGSTMVIRQTVQLEQTQTSNNSADGDIGLRQAIPIMPMYLAVVCCLLNVLSPGLGTFVAGVSMMCCSRPQRENIDYSSLLLINIWVAIFQLISSILFLIGWIWSVIWGFNFITISNEFNSKQGDGQSGERDDSSDRCEGERATDAGGRTSTTTRTTAVTRTTTTTVSLPDDPATASVSPSVTREPPIIVLQEAPVAPNQDGLLDAAAAAIWIERQRTLHDPSRTAARARVSADARTRSNSAAVPMSRRQRLNRRRRQAAVTAAAAPEPWNDPLTGVLLCPEALEHIVVHSSIVPDSSSTAGPSGVAVTVQTAK